MSEPEIARRCHACGASIRDHALFCPECGKELKTTSELVRAASDDAKPSSAAETAPLTEDIFPTGALAASKSADDSRAQESGSISKTEVPNPKGPPSKSPPVTAKKTEPKGSPAGTPGAKRNPESRGMVQRATGLAKHVGGDVVQRGHKVREMSSVVWDEAGYDPSLRFVLVAAVLFVLFLIFVLLNRFIV